MLQYQKMDVTTRVLSLLLRSKQNCFCFEGCKVEYTLTREKREREGAEQEIPTSSKMFIFLTFYSYMCTDLSLKVKGL